MKAPLPLHWLLVGDTTIEALAPILQGNPWDVLLYRDELVVRQGKSDRLWPDAVPQPLAEQEVPFEGRFPALSRQRAGAREPPEIH